ncbi:MAG: biosynthetic-type acetolactate synthase large subunit [Nitrososphaeria archaeon]
MVRLSGARALVESLKLENVGIVFGYPGGAIIPVYDELKDSGIRHILARHEQCAAHMADGYARASRRVGVVVATSGPGATNLVTGIATAHLDSSPVVAITGQVPTSLLDTDAFQEADVPGIFNPITKYVFQPRSASEVPYSVKAAFYLASTGRTGPVVVDIPKDVQTKVDDMSFPDKVTVRGYTPYIEPDSTAVARAAEILLSAEKPILLAGGGVKRSCTEDVLLALANNLMLPVVTTFMGKGSFPEDHILSMGTIGMHGTYQANTLITEADVVVSFGARFSDRSTMDINGFTNRKKVIQFDIDPTEVGKNIEPTEFVVGDLRRSMTMFCEELMKRAITKNESPWLKRVISLKQEYDEKVFGNNGNNGLSSPKIIKKIREVLPSESIVTTEVGQNQMWAKLYFKVAQQGLFITSGGLGTMGFGFPAAIGAKAAKPSVPVLDIAGDGSFQMTCNSLATSVTENLPVIVCILNNSSLGLVAQWQRTFYNKRYYATWLGSTPDFVKLAHAYGAEGVRVQSLDELERALKQALRCEVTTVIDIPISPEEDVLPFVPTGGSLKDMLV